MTPSGSSARNPDSQTITGRSLEGEAGRGADILRDERSLRESSVQTRRFGPIAQPVAVIGQGTWGMERERAAAVAALRRGLDAGMTHIDTAEMYGDGAVEELVAEAIAGRRDEVFLVSKVLPQNASRRGTVAACERSLARLRADRLDLYLLHWPGDHPLADTIAAFEELRAAGKIRAWGVSNFAKDELADAVRIAGPGRVACNQVLYHLRERAIEHEVIPYCAEHGIAVVAYSPFGSGSFPDRDRTLRAIADAHGATPRQVALRFLVRDPNVFTIPKASRAQHALDNAAASGLALDADEIARIERAFPRGRKRRGVPTI
jgi:diketogulonate reductase-like aldo/keto reductase